MSRPSGEIKMSDRRSKGAYLHLDMQVLFATVLTKVVPVPMKLTVPLGKTKVNTVNEESTRCVEFW